MGGTWAFYDRGPGANGGGIFGFTVSTPKAESQPISIGAHFLRRRISAPTPPPLHAPGLWFTHPAFFYPHWQKTAEMGVLRSSAAPAAAVATAEQQQPLQPADTISGLALVLGAMDASTSEKCLLYVACCWWWRRRWKQAVALLMEVVNGLWPTNPF